MRRISIAPTCTGILNFLLTRPEGTASSRPAQAPRPSVRFAHLCETAWPNLTAKLAQMRGEQPPLPRPSEATQSNAEPCTATQSSLTKTTARGLVAEAILRHLGVELGLPDFNVPASRRYAVPASDLLDIWIAKAFAFLHEDAPPVDNQAKEAAITFAYLAWPLATFPEAENTNGMLDLMDELKTRLSTPIGTVTHA